MKKIFLIGLLISQFLNIASILAQSNIKIHAPQKVMNWQAFAAQSNYLQIIVGWRNDTIACIAKKEQKFALLDRKGATLKPYEYDNLQYLTADMFVFEKQKKLGFLALEALQNPSEAVYEQFHNLHYSYILAKKNDKWGGLYQGGQEIIEFEQDSIMLAFCGGDDGMSFSASKNGKWGFHRTISGERCKFEYIYDSLHFYRSSYTYCKDGSCGFNIFSGRKSTPYKGLRCSPYIGFFYAYKNGKWGLIDTDLKIILPFEYDLVDIPALYPQGYPQYELSKNGQVGFFNESTQQFALRPSESPQEPEADEDIKPISAEKAPNKITIAQNNGKWGLSEPLSNEVLIPFEYDSISPTNHPNCFIVKKNGLYSVITSQKKLIFPETEQPLSPSITGNIWEKTQNGWIWTDLRDKIGSQVSDILPILGDSTEGFEIIRQSNKMLVFYPLFNQTYPLGTYDNLRLAGAGGTNKPYLYAQKAGKWGIIDTKNMQVLGFEYDEIHSFDLVKDIFEVTQNNKRLRINALGKVLN